MKIIFTQVAKIRLKEIYTYYKDNASVKVAKSIKEDILDEIRILGEYPELGNKEAYLSRLKHGHRKLVMGNYKAIYRIVDNTIVIDTIFDSRQEPKELTKDIKVK